MLAPIKRAASRFARDGGADSARFHRGAVARSDRETWTGCGITISGSPGGGLKYLSKVARSKFDEDNSGKWGTAGRRQPREPTSRAPTRTQYCSFSNTVDAKAKAPGIYIYGLKPVPPCMPYSYDIKESPRDRSREPFLPTGAHTTAAYLRAANDSGENNLECGGGGGGRPATLFGSFARQVHLRRPEEGENGEISSRESAARDVQSFFSRMSRSRRHTSGWRIEEPRGQEEHRSLIHSQMLHEGAGCRRYHEDGSFSGDADIPASSQIVNHVVSHCPVDNASNQPPVGDLSVSKLRLRVITVWWTDGVVNAAITKATGHNAVHHDEKRRVPPSPEMALVSARVFALDFMANITWACLLYAVLAHGLPLTTSAAEQETTPLSPLPSAAAMTSAETSHICAKTPGTGYHNSWAEHRKIGEDTQMTNRVSKVFGNSSPAHGIAHIFFPAPPCSTSLVLPDHTDRNCRGVSSLLVQQGGTSSSALFARLDGGEMEEVDDRSTLTAASVLNGGSPTSAVEDGYAADISNPVLFDNFTGWNKAGGHPGRLDTSGRFTPIDAPTTNKTRDISEKKLPVPCSGIVQAPIASKTMPPPEDKPSVHSPGTANRVAIRRRESCVPGSYPGSAQTAVVQVSFAGIGTRPAVAVRSSVTSGLKRKGGGFLFKKRQCSPRPGCGGNGGGGSADDGGGEESVTSLISSSTIGHNGSEEPLSRSSLARLPRSSLTGLHRGEPINASDVVAAGLDSGATAGRRRVLPLRTRHCHTHHVIGDDSQTGEGAGGNRDTGIVRTIFGVATDRLSKAANDGAVAPTEKVEEPSAVGRRCRVLVSGQRDPRSDPRRSRREFPITGKGTGVDAQMYRGSDNSAATESSGRGVEGSASTRTTVNSGHVCVKLPRRVPRKPSRGATTQSSTTSPRKQIVERRCHGLTSLP